MTNDLDPAGAPAGAPAAGQTMAGADADRFVIVSAVDLSSMSATVIAHALDSAGRHHACDIHVISVVPLVAGLPHRALDPAEEIVRLACDARAPSP